MGLCIGRIPFLVCAPFFCRFFTKSEASEGIFHELCFADGVPSELNARLLSGDVHLAPASSFNYGLHGNEFFLAENLCTSCNLEVRSVRLFSKVPIEDLHQKKIHLTSKSASSVALLRVLFSLRFHLEPEFVSGKPYAPARDCARLLIGDDALIEKSPEFSFVYDLGTLWQEWQKMPFVFGAWSIRRDISRTHESLLSSFLLEAEKSVEEFRRNPGSALSLWLSRYPVKISLEEIQSYFGVLDYAFTEERKESLSIFFRLCAQIGLLREAPKLEFFKPDFS